MNMASIWKLPVIYALEHNQYGEYSPSSSVTAGLLDKRGEVFDIPTTRVDGMDVLQVYDAASEAVAHARAGKGPAFLVCVTYRYGGHGMSDRDRAYRTRDEENEWRTKDALERLGAQLQEAGLASQSELDALKAEVEQEMDQAVQYGMNAPAPTDDQVREHVYADS
jgi:pyruvate dehydrogenase E1 component alpha subunit